MKTIKYVVLAQDNMRDPCWVWGTQKDTSWGNAQPGVRYNGYRIAAFKEEEERDEAVRIARVLRGQLQRWEYERGALVRIKAEKKVYASKTRAT